MKNILLTSCILACSATLSHAQITLTAATMNPIVGNSFSTINCDTSAANLKLSIFAADTGANHVWNYTGLTSISLDTALEVTCASTPNCSMFLSATNMAAKTLSSSAYVYSIINSDSVSTTGYYASATQNAILTNPMKQLKYPFSFRDSFTDAYAGSITFDPGLGTGPITAHEAGNLHVVCDGWGILKIPTNVDSNTVRIHGTQTFIDSASIFGSPVAITVAINTFQWYMLNYHSPVMSVTFTDQIAGPGTPIHIKTVSYARKYPVGISNVAMLENSLQLFPNPASDQLNVQFDVANSTKVRIALIDLLGREVAVMANAEFQGQQQISCNTNGLSKGMYIVRLQSEGETVNRKVTIQ